MVDNNSLRVTALEDSCTVTLQGYHFIINSTGDPYDDSVSLNTGDYCLIYGDHFPSEVSPKVFLSVNKQFKLSGNIMSLVDNGACTTVVIDQIGAFESFINGGLYSTKTNLRDISELLLPATTLADGCYYNMFNGCSNIETLCLPLPAESIPKSGYSAMFENCTSIKTVDRGFFPENITGDYRGAFWRMFGSCTSLTSVVLPGVAGDGNGALESTHSGMFANCTNLSQVEVDFTDWNDGKGTLGWLDFVASTGFFIKPKELEAKFGANFIPSGWQPINKPIPQRGSATIANAIRFSLH